MSTAKRRPSTKVFAIAAVIVALVLAGIVSFYASGSPDGLNRVAEDKGFAGQERDSATADSPFADYATEAIDNERFSGAVAGIVGVTVVLVIAGGLAAVVRRRQLSDVEFSDRGPTPSDDGGESETASADHSGNGRA